MSAPVNCVCLHPNQAELVVGDQSGVIHLWDLKTDHNEQLVILFILFSMIFMFINLVLVFNYFFIHIKDNNKLRFCMA